MGNNVTFDNRIAQGVFTLAALQNPSEVTMTSIYKDREFVYSEEILRGKMSSVGKWFFTNLTSLYTFFQRDTVYNVVRAIISDYLNHVSEANFNTVSGAVIANMKIEGQPNPWISEDQVKTLLQEVKTTQKEKLFVPDEFKKEVLQKIKKVVLDSSPVQAQIVFNRIFYRGIQSFNSNNWNLVQRINSQVLPLYEDLIENYLSLLEKSPENHIKAKEYAKAIITKLIEGLSISLEVKVDASSYVNEAIEDAKRKLVSEFKIYLPQFDESLRKNILAEFITYVSRTMKEQNILDRHHPKLKEMISSFLEQLSHLKKEEMQEKFCNGSRNDQILDEISAPKLPVTISLLTVDEQKTREANVRGVCSKVSDASKIYGSPNDWLSDEEIDKIGAEIIAKSPIELYETEHAQQALFNEVVKRILKYVPSKLPAPLSKLFKKVERYNRSFRKRYNYCLNSQQELTSIDKARMEAELRKTGSEIYNDIWTRFHNLNRLFEGEKGRSSDQYRSLYSNRNDSIDELGSNYAKSLINLLITHGSIGEFYDYKAFQELRDTCIDLKKRQALLVFKTAFISRIPQDVSKPVRAIMIRDFLRICEKFMSDYQVFDQHIVDEFRIDYLINYVLNDVDNYIRVHTNSPEAIHAMNWLDMQDKQSIPIYFLDYLYLIKDQPNKLQYIKSLVPHAAKLLSELHLHKDQENAEKYYLEKLTIFSSLIKDEHFVASEPKLRKFLNDLKENGIYIPEELLSSVFPYLPKIIEISNQIEKPNLLEIRKSLPEIESLLVHFLWHLKSNNGSLVHCLQDIFEFGSHFIVQDIQEMKDPKNIKRKELYQILATVNAQLQGIGVGAALGAVNFVNGVDKGFNFARNLVGLESKYSDQQIIGKLLEMVNGLKNKFIPKTAPKELLAFVDFAIHLTKGAIENHRLIPFITCFDSFRTLMGKLEKAVDPRKTLDDDAINGVLKEYFEFSKYLTIALEGLLKEVKHNTFESNCLNSIFKALNGFQIDVNNPNYLAQVIQGIIVPIAEEILKMPGLVSGKDHEQLEVTFLDEKRLSKI